MLFLAVFCGFLAEYALEHKIEKDRERQFIKSLANDIKADIIHLNSMIERRNQKLQRLDSLVYLLNSPQSAKSGNGIYFNAIHTSRVADIRFTPNIGTIQQLKNAGGLRLIRNRKVVDSITKYDASVRNLETLGEQEVLISDEYRKIASHVFNASVFDSMMDEENNASRPSGNPSLLTVDKPTIDALKYSIYLIKVVNKGIRRDAKKLLQQATNLLAIINKSYHLE